MPLTLSIPLYLIIFLYGALIGSFLNVCIYRIPKHENIAVTRSHCMSCGYQLKWYDLVPIFSYIGLRGRCRHCKEPISIQYPLIEAANALLYVFIFAVNGWEWLSVIYCLMSSALLVLSVIDFRTYEIPLGINIFLMLLGAVATILDISNWADHVIGFFSVSVFLYIIYLASGGSAIGGGDVKLTAACGLLLGWKSSIFSLLLGCILGSVIHIARMKISHADRVLAMGPYLSAAMLITALWGKPIINWYIRLLM